VRPLWFYFFEQHVHPLHVGLSVHLDRSAFAYSTFSSTFHIFRLLRCYSHSYFFAFSLCMVFARACAAHVSFCDFLAISFSSSYLTAIASFSTFHVSLALGTSLFLHVLDTCLSPAHVRNAILTRCILFSIPYAIVHLPLALLISFLPFCTATCGHSEFCFGKHARPLHVEHSVHFD
jgi:hypothetical protein